LVILLFAVLIAAAAIWMGVAKSRRPGDYWFEVTKAGIQLCAIAILGGLVAFAFRVLDDRRATERRNEELGRADRLLRDQYLAGVADELWGSYRQIKAARRTLRAAGFDRILDPGAQSRERSGKISERQSAEYRTQMNVLDDMQLTLETLKRDVETQRSMYKPNASLIESNLHRAEHYVNKVLKDWEDHSEYITAGADFDDVRARLTNLPSFLGGAKEVGGLKELSDAVGEAARWIQSLRFSAQPESPDGSETRTEDRTEGAKAPHGEPAV
jgi:hypothetical protein